MTSPVVAPPRGASPMGLATLRRSARMLRTLRRACRQVFGIPDYEAYCAHMAQNHPDEAPLSRAAFFRMAIDRRYARRGPRCC